MTTLQGHNYFTQPQLPYEAKATLFRRYIAVGSHVGYAESRDAQSWYKPRLQPDGSNLLSAPPTGTPGAPPSLRSGLLRTATCSVMKDERETDDAHRFFLKKSRSMPRANAEHP